MKTKRDREFYVKGFFRGAAEQREIDIVKACESFCKARCPEYHGLCSKKDGECGMYVDFCKILKGE